MNPLLNSPVETRVGFWDRIDDLSVSRDPATHPFYSRITDGAADLQELFLHASELEHLVLAVARLSQMVAGMGAGLDSARDLVLGAFDDRERVTLWRRYARALGWGPSMAHLYAEDPLPETTECAKSWRGNATEGLAAGLIRMNAAAEVMTRMAAPLAAALRLHYGFNGDPALLYFDRQARDGVNQIRLSRQALDSLTVRGDDEELAGLAEDVHLSHWAVADGLTNLRTGA